MAADVHNPQYDPGTSKFFTTLPAGTGAPGSPGDSASETAGPVIGNPVISAPYGSSQLDVNMPRVSVTAGSTSSMSSDQSVQASPITPGPADQYLTTGAGSGSGAHYPRRPGQQPNGGQ